MRVEVYFNLHKKKLSVRCCSTRRVISHTSEITLDDAEFRVSESGRQRVLQQRRKNVHAYVRGRIAHSKRTDLSRNVTYNPYKFSSFVDTNTFTSVHSAQQVHISGRNVTCTGN